MLVIGDDCHPHHQRQVNEMSGAQEIFLTVWGQIIVHILSGRA